MVFYRLTLFFIVKFFVHFTKLLISDVGVNLRGSNTGVAKHGLDTANVGAIAKEIGGKAVTKYVWCNFFRNTGEHGVLMNEPLDRTGREAHCFVLTTRNFSLRVHLRGDTLTNICVGNK